MLRFALALAVVLSASLAFAANPDAPSVRVRFDAKYGNVYTTLDSISGVYYTLNKDGAASNSLATVWSVSGPHGSRIQVRARETTAGKCIWDTLITDMNGDLASQSHIVQPNTAMGIFTGPQYPSPKSRYNPQTMRQSPEIRCYELGTFTISP